MAALDFPNGPTLGQIFTAPGGSPTYVWNGTAWVAAGQVAGPVTEQTFDMSGKTAQDITVPSWARSCEIEGYAAGLGAQMLVMRYSIDGTTFIAGASDYGYYGPLHNTGTDLYKTQAPASASFMYLTFQGDFASVPHHVVANITLTRPDTAKVLGLFQSQAQDVDNAAASGYRTLWLSGYLGTTPAGSALRLAALRILTNTGAAMPAGSWARVKWFGDSAQVPIAGAIAEAPMDGGDYVRQNGVWRSAAVSKISSGTLASAAAQVDIALPAGYNMLELLVNSYMHSVTAQQALMRFSFDGTTFPASGNYASAFNTSGSNSANVPGGATAANHLIMTGGMAVTAVTGASARIQLPQPITGNVQQIMYDWAYQDAGAGSLSRSAGAGFYVTSVGRAVIARLLPASGNINAGMSWQLNGYR